MDAVKPPGFTTEQKRMYYQLLLTMLVGLVVASVLHKEKILFTLVFVGWMTSILYQGRAGYWAITRGTLAMGVLAYILYRFVFPEAL